DTFPCLTFPKPIPCIGANKTPPVAAAPAVTLDDSGKIWVFFGTGRFYSTADKADTNTQYLFGVKDSVLSLTCTQTTAVNCWGNDLVNVSSAQICVVCTGGTNQVTGVTSGGVPVTTFEGTGTTSLIGLVQSKDGWFTTLPTAGDRSLAIPTILGGIVFFTTFVPVNDICVAQGDSSLYALFYQTGTAYKTSVIGTTASGSDTLVNRSISLGTGSGLAAQAAVHIGGQGGGTSGTGGSGSGCQSGTSLYIQSSTGAVNQSCATTGSVVSRYISWINQRD
ncbi:MAG TPA: hypothetical protein VFL31_02585, partial [Nitrospiraceae bacterium]|nr:hypothetical protein [Nitrospiraceae bacterium]